MSHERGGGYLSLLRKKKNLCTSKLPAVVVRSPRKEQENEGRSGMKREREKKKPPGGNEVEGSQEGRGLKKGRRYGGFNRSKAEKEGGRMRGICIRFLVRRERKEGGGKKGKREGRDGCEALVGALSFFFLPFGLAFWFLPFSPSSTLQFFLCILGEERKGVSKGGICGAGYSYKIARSRGVGKAKRNNFLKKLGECLFFFFFFSISAVSSVVKTVSRDFTLFSFPFTG